MPQDDYDSTSIESVLSYAARLYGHTLAEVATLPPGTDNKKHKGNLGSLVEKYFFKLSTADGAKDSQPDFVQLGLELKTTGVIKTSNSQLRAKERLVLTMINYMEIVDEEWDSSTLHNKCKEMLLLFYLYEKDVPAQDLRFVLPPHHFKFPEGDLVQIKQDWHRIQAKVLAGKAHELSEGDTFYLGACRKGAGGPGEPLRRQPFSDTPAKARAFSLKPAYVNRVISAHAAASLQWEATRPLPVEDATQSRFEPFLGLTTEEIALRLAFEIPVPRPKNLLRLLSEKILTGSGGVPRELELGQIELKTVRLKESGMPKEAMSFPSFDFLEMASQDWEDSDFFERLERRFLFVIFRIGADQGETLERVRYWNMPFEDREDARLFWEQVKNQVRLDTTKIGSLKSRTSHVRTHGRDGNDKLPTPQGGYWARSSFWLNQTYMKEVLKDL